MWLSWAGFTDATADPEAILGSKASSTVGHLSELIISIWRGSALIPLALKWIADQTRQSTEFLN